MKQLLPGTALAVALVLGSLGPAGAQVVDPKERGSASGGLQAQAGQAGHGGGSPGHADPRSGGSGMSEERSPTAMAPHGHADGDEERRGDVIRPQR